MTEKHLKCEYIPSRAQIGNAEGMSKTVRVAFLNAGFFTQCIDHLAQRVFVESMVGFPNEQRRVKIISIVSISQVTPDRAPGCFAQKDSPSLTALRSAPDAMLDIHLAGVQVYIAHT